MDSLYQKRLPENLRETFSVAMRDENLVSLRDELALLKTLLAQYVNQLQNEEGLDEMALDAVGRTVDRVAKAFHAISAHEKKLKTHVPITVVQELMRCVLKVIQTYVQDDNAIHMIANEFGELPYRLMHDVFGPGPREIDGEEIRELAKPAEKPKRKRKPARASD